MTKPHASDHTPEIFVSHSHENRDWVKALGLDQIPASTENASFWLDENRLYAGDDWTNEAEHAVKRAKAAVLLISRSSLASSPIIEKEVPLIISRYQSGHICVVFVPIGPLCADEIAKKLSLPNINNIISIPGWANPLPIRAEPRSDIREQIISAATESREVQNLRRTLAGRYALKRRIGNGHFSTLFTSHENQLKRGCLSEVAA
jgi:hypothetical protein